MITSVVFSFLKTSPELFSEEEFLPLDPTQELIFPPELMVKKTVAHLEEIMVKCQEGPFQKLTVQLSDLLRDTVQGKVVKQLVKVWTIIICRVLGVNGTSVSYSLPRPPPKTQGP